MAGTNIYGQMIRAQLQSSATDLTTPVNGLLYYNSVAGSVKWYNGSAWKSAVIDGGTATDLSLSNPTTGASSALVQIPQMTTTQKNALVAPVTGRLVFDLTLQSLYVYNGSSWTPAGGGSSLLAITTPASPHGFVTADLGAPLYLTAGGVYTKAKADAANTAEVIGLIGSIIDANSFNLVMVGQTTVNTAVTGGAMVVGSTYYVSAATAGLLTATEPSVIGQVSKPVGVAISTTVLEFVNMRGVVVGGTNALTTIAFANNATSNIQDVGSYQGGELSGYVSISATTSSKFFIKAQFSKNAAGTDFNLSWQYSGETPPASFVMSVTTAGLIQITIGTLAGFTAASITYGLNVAAVGATFPLSINSDTVINQILHVRDEKASGTDGGTSSVGSNIRVLNTVVKNTISGASLASNQITLPAGAYTINASAPASWPNRTRLRLVNVTDSSVVLLGVAGYSFPAADVAIVVSVIGSFTLTATKVLNLTQYFQTSRVSYGLGIDVGDTFTNVYAEAFITKIG